MENENMKRKRMGMLEKRRKKGQRHNGERDNIYWREGKRNKRNTIVKKRGQVWRRKASRAEKDEGNEEDRKWRGKERKVERKTGGYVERREE